MAHSALAVLFVNGIGEIHYDLPSSHNIARHTLITPPTFPYYQQAAAYSFKSEQ